MIQIKQIQIILIYFLISISLAKADFIMNRNIIKSGTKLICGIAQVDDGDTFDLECGESYIPNVRLFGVNAPDIEGPNGYKHCYYNESKSAINLIINRELNVEFFGSDLCKDNYKGCRNLVKLTDIKTGVDINELLISKGYMFSWINFSNITIEYKLNLLRSEKIAKENNAGLWGKCSVNYNLNALIDSGIPTKMTN